MPIYFLVLDGGHFHNRLRPVLAECWRRRSFEAARGLCDELIASARDFIPSAGAGADETVLVDIVRGLPFDRQRWRLLVGEALLYAAVEMPLLETAPETLRCLLEPGRFRTFSVPREQFTAIEQVHHGARDLSFGDGYYRPDRAGWNDVADVARLADYLAAVDPKSWNVADLAGLDLPEDERSDELDFVREWFPVLQELYRRSAELGRVIVCEDL